MQCRLCSNLVLDVEAIDLEDLTDEERRKLEGKVLIQTDNIHYIPNKCSKIPIGRYMTSICPYFENNPNNAKAMHDFITFQTFNKDYCPICYSYNPLVQSVLNDTSN